jgi:hypothetical protein
VILHRRKYTAAQSRTRNHKAAIGLFFVRATPCARMAFGVIHMP